MGETLSFYIAYDAFGQPKKRTKVTIRKYSTKTELEEVDLYNPAKKNWEKHQKHNICTIRLVRYRLNKYLFSIKISKYS